MGRYVGTRVLELLPVLLLVSIVAFLLLHLVPGDPARIMLGTRATPAAVLELRAQLGLDRSLPAQYWDFLSGAVSFDFGSSIRTRESVGELIGRRLGPSLLLVGYTLLVALLIAIPSAVLAAVKRGRWADQGIRFVSTIALAMPPFWLGLLLVLLVSLQLGWLPTSGYGDGFAEHVKSLTLPAITGAMFLATLLMRQLRTSVIVTLQSEYVEAARARGLAERRVMGRHVLRNSAGPTVTLVAIFAGVLLSLTVVVENIFAIPGLGSLLVDSVRVRDFPVVQALTLLFALTTLIASLLADVLYALIDPRVRL